MPTGGLSEGAAACVVGVEVVHHTQRGHVHVSPVDGGGGAGLWLVDRILGSPILSRIPGAVPYGVRAVLGHHPWYHGARPR